MKLAIGADIGGTHITAALIDLQKKTIVPSSIVRADVNAGGTSDEIITAWSDCIKAAQQNKKVDSICLAMPGPFDYEAGISLMRGQAKYESLYELNVKEKLAATLNCSQQSIYIDNDAACFLQGEVTNKFEDNNVIGVTLGTGLGSAVYKGSVSKNADMWCWPFKGGIAEDLLSTRWFVQRWKVITGEVIDGVKSISKLSLVNEDARKIFDEFAINLSDFIQDFISNESPSIVIIGGNISKAFERFGPAIKERFPTIKIEKATLGEEASLMGAVGSWLQKQKTKSIHEYTTGS
jgi:glucokinase